MNFRYIINLLAAVSVLFCAYPSNAQETDELEVYSGKTAEIDTETNKGTITLETYMEGRLIRQAAPCDIVLVLDMSSSMDLVYGKDEAGHDITRLQALKNACNSFLTSLKSTGVAHRVSIVTFNEYANVGYTGSEVQDATVIWPLDLSNCSHSGSQYYLKGGMFGNENTFSNNKIYFSSDAAQRTRMTNLYNWVNSKYSDYFIPIDDRPDFDNSKTTLEHILDYFSADDTQGTTACFRGMKEASKLVNNRNDFNGIDKSDRPTFVIMFTDGIPGHTDPEGSDDSIFSDGRKSICFAYNTIAYANQMKNKGTKVFTVGIHPDCKPVPEVAGDPFYIRLQFYSTGGMSPKSYYYFTNTSAKRNTYDNHINCDNALNVFLHMVSSNYYDTNMDTSPCRYDTNYDHDEVKGKGMERWSVGENGSAPTISIQKKTEIVNGKHYHSASDPAELINEFEEISEDIIEYAKEEMTSETQLRDYIDGRFFKLPDDVTVESIVCYARQCIGKTSDGKYKFAENHIDIPGLSVQVKAGVEGQDDEVVVTGFDYKANWVGALKESPDIDKPGDWHGQELIVIIPFVLKDDVDASGTLQTNTEDSGIYLPGEEEPYKPYPVPEVTWSMINITRTGLEVGESAIYYVYAAEVDSAFDDKPTYIVTLNRENSSAVAKKTIAHVLARQGHENQDDGYYKYKVVETGWNWAYESDSSEETQSFSRANRQLDFFFSGAHKDSSDTDSPTYKLNHGESYKSSSYSIIQQ